MRLLFQLFVVACVFLISPNARAEKRIALVIGNSAYRHVAPLINPRNDATDLSASLRRVGFEVVEGFDLTGDDLRRSLRRFSESLEGADVALLFYAGHALQVAGVNYIIPVDTQLTREADLEFETVSLDFVIRLMEKEARTLLVFLDACRDNPLTRRFVRSSRSAGSDAGLARPNASAEGLFIAFSTEPNNVALDGEGRNSPFTRALLRHIERPGIEISELMTDVRRDVFEATGKRQLPFTNSGLLGRFYFAPGERQDGALAAGDQNRLILLQEESDAWEAARNANTPEALRDFMARFPSGHFTELAQLQLDRLNGKNREGKLPGDSQVATLGLTRLPESKPGFIDWLSPKDYQAFFDGRLKVKQYPAEVECAFVDYQYRIRAKYLKYPRSNFGFYSYTGMDKATFDARRGKFGREGYLIASQQIFNNGEKDLYCATWTK